MKKHPADEIVNIGAELLRPGTHSKHSAITNVDPLGVIERFTFADVAREATLWASLVRRNELRPGDRVVVVAGPAWEWRCALLGILYAGGVGVPCPDSASADELQGIAADAEAGLVVSIDGRPDLVDREALRVLRGEQLGTVDERVARSQPPHPTSPNDDALILYRRTASGLRGAVHTHASLAAQAKSGEHWLGVGENERVWCTATDGSAESIWLLLAAGRVHADIVNVNLELDAEGQLELLGRLHPSAVWLSDEEYRVLGSAEAPGWIDLGSIRRTLSNEESTAGATAFAEAVGAAVTPLIGLNEVGVVAGWPAGMEGQAVEATAIPVPGIPLSIVDEQGKLLSADHVGNVVVRGDAPSLWSGYTRGETKRRDAWFHLHFQAALGGDNSLRLATRPPLGSELTEAEVEMSGAELVDEVAIEQIADAHEPSTRESKREAKRARRREEREAREQRKAEERGRREEERSRKLAERAEAKKRKEAERAEDEKRREQERLAKERTEADTAGRASGEAAEAEEAKTEKEERAQSKAAEAEERRRAEKAAQAEEQRREKEAKQREQERLGEEKEARRRDEQLARERAKAEAEEAARREAAEAKEQARREAEEKEERRRGEVAAQAEAEERSRREAAAAKERRRAEEAARAEEQRHEKEAEQREQERLREEAEARRQEEQLAKQRAKAETKERAQREASEADERRRAEQAARAEEQRSEKEAKQREKERLRQEEEARRREERLAKESAKAEAKEQARREAAEAEARRRAEEAARAEERRREQEEKQREREEKEARRREEQLAKERAKAEAEERAQREAAQAEERKRAEDAARAEERRREKEEKEREQERRRDEKEARRREERQAKEAARAERKTARLGRRRRSKDSEPHVKAERKKDSQPEPEPEHVTADIRSRISLYGMSAASTAQDERPEAEAPTDLPSPPEPAEEENVK
jgi:acyl-coenzyme A synthetase/AMP-(fatty) acid ligase